MDRTTVTDIKTEVTKRIEAKCDIQHNLHHIQSVTKNALDISQKYDVDTNLIEAICYVHDLTYTVHNPSIKTYIFEGKYIAAILNKFLSIFNINNIEKEIIINACRKHPHSFPFRKLNRNSDIYTKILQDADTLDYFSERRINNFIKNNTFGLFNLSRLLRIIRSRFINYFLNLPPH
jgi:HD superfamily phosphodiesterase